MSLRRGDLKYLLHIAGIRNTPNTLTELQDLYEKYEEIAQKGLKRLEHWHDTANDLKDMIIKWKGSSAASIAKSLSIINKHNFPFSTTVLGANAHALVMAYYKYNEMDYLPTKVKFNDTQKKIINFDKIKLIVNAGPGTGKTTTAVGLVRHKLYENDTNRVLILTYTRAANRVFKESLNRYPDLYENSTSNYFKSGRKGIPKRILLSTIDSIARQVVTQGKMATYGTNLDAAVNYNEIINIATLMIKEDPSSLRCFIYSGQHFLFNTIIVDEAQTMDDGRGALITAMLEGLNKISKKPIELRVFCDPKQTIGGPCPDWIKTAFTQWDSISLDISYRFASTSMLEHVMHFSRAHGAYHVELTIPEAEMQDKVVHAFSINDIDNMARKVSTVVTDNNYTVGIIAPTIGKCNIVSQQVNATILALNKHGLTCGIFSDANYKTNGATVSTIHSSAGAEYDIVILVGLSGYPGSMPTEKDGKSLLFIANSRARHNIIYIYDKPMLCEGLDINTVKVHGNMSMQDYSIPKMYDIPIPEYWTGEILFGQSGNTNELGGLYMRTNNMRAIINENIVKIDKLSQSISLYDRYKLFKKVKSLNDYVKPKEGTVKIVSSRSIYKGLCTKGIALPPYALALQDCKDTRQAFYHARNMLDKVGVTDNTKLEAALGIDVDKFSTIKPCTRYVSRAGDIKFIYAPDYINAQDRTLICIQDNIYEAMYHLVMFASHKKLTDWTGIIIESNRIITVTLSEMLIDNYMFHIASLSTIRAYDIRATFRERTLNTDKAIPKRSLYATDTEFISEKDRREVYDVAMINVYKPYESIVSILKVNGDLPKEKYIKAQLSNNNYENISKYPDDVEILIEQGSVLYYFMEKTDYHWISDTSCLHKIIDMAEIASVKMQERGVFMSNSATFNMAAFYGEFVGPCDENNQHRAVYDACMLAECMRLI